MSEKRLISSVRIFTFLCESIGFLPLKFSVPGSVKISVPKLCYGIILILTLSGFRCYSGYLYAANSLGVVSKLNLMVAMISPACVLFSYTCFIMNIKKSSQILSEIFTLSDLISTSGFYRNGKKLTISQTLIIIVLLFAISINKIYVSFDDFGSYWYYDFEFYMDQLVEFYTRFAIALIPLIFANVLLFFRKLIGIINEDLSSMVDGNTSLISGSLKAVDGEKLQESKILKIAPDADNVTSLINMHCHICDLCGDWNRFFGGSLTAFSLQVLIQVLSCIFWVITWTDKRFPGNLLGNILYHSMAFWFVLYSCELVKEEAMRSRLLVHKLIKGTNNIRVKSQLQDFSAELSDRNLSFSAWRIFPLDYALLHSIAATIATYIIILVQFRDGEGSSQNSNESTTPCDCSAIE